MILITGANGKTGRAVLKALTARRESVRAMVHRVEQKDELTSLGATEVICGDFHDEPFLMRAFQDVQKVYHICPNVQPDEIDIGKAAIRAAKLAGVEHFVYHSVLHPQVEEMPHHWRKLRVEEWLFKSRLQFTILQPAAYMQNVLAQLENIINQGVYSVPYAASTRLGMVDLADVAQAAALVLTQPGHAGAVYELAGVEAPTQTEVAETIARVLQKPVRVEVTPLDAWEQRARTAGMPDYAVDTLLRMFRYYEQYGFWGNANTLARLLGRQPTPFDRFVSQVVSDRHGSVNGKTS
jgi:NAD(P)H dehydrogenase (quinone)